MSDFTLTLALLSTIQPALSLPWRESGVRCGRFNKLTQLTLGAYQMAGILVGVLRGILAVGILVAYCWLVKSL